MKAFNAPLLSIFLGVLVWNFNTPLEAQEQIVNTYTTLNQEAPSIAAQSDGTFLVVWQSEGQDGDGSGVFARRLGTDGVPLGNEIAVPVTTLSAQLQPNAAALNDGRFVVVWASEYGDESVQARFFDAAGNAVGGEFQVNSDPVTQASNTFPVVAEDNFGGFAVVWAADGLDGDNLGIRFRTFDSTGAPTQKGILVISDEVRRGLVKT